MYYYRRISINIIVASLLLLPNPAHQLFGKSRQNQEIQNAINQLVSDAGLEREKARNKLIQLNSEAMPYLLLLLEETISSTFAEPSEQIVSTPPLSQAAISSLLLDPLGMKAARISFENNHWYIRIETEPNGGDKKVSVIEALEQVKTIKQRVRNDLLHILRQLNAEKDAIAILAKNLYQVDFSHDSGIEILPGMEALILIGAKATPSVINILETAEIPPASKINSGMTLSFGDKEKDAKFMADTIRARTAYTLGEIGNPEALPHLIKTKIILKEQHKLDTRTASYIDEAIEKIKKKNDLK